MSSERWAVITTLFHELRDIPPDARERELRLRTSDMGAIRHVHRLLRADDVVGSRFDRPAVLHVARNDAEEVHDVTVAADTVDTTLSMVGRRLGPYDVVRRIGEGGMGTVYEAHRADDAFSQRVAIKTVWRDVDSTLLARRLRSEREFLAMLQHPNIASLIDGGSTTEGLPYLVMEYVEGAPIDQWCDEHHLSIPLRLDLFRQVCSAVSHAHRRLLVHRDLKPSNVFVNSEGGVKLLDFGVAKLLGDSERLGTLTGAGVSPFTVAFAAPEQVEHAPITTATDVYALGALLYLLLTGHTAVDVGSGSVADAILAVRDGVVIPPSASAMTTVDAGHRGFASSTRLSRALQGELDDIVMMAMRREPTRRYASADAIADDVQSFLRGDRVLARTDTAAYRLRTFVRRHRAAAVGIGVTAVALVVGSAASLYQANVIRLEASRAERASVFLMHMAGEPDAHFGDPFSRIGPNGRIAELIDSSLARVPVAFPADPRIRARLYTALGASLTASGQVRRAAAVLDSARRLSRASYGQTSHAYIEATVNASNAAFHFQPPRVAVALARDALRALGPSRDRFPELRARAILAEATATVLDARFAESDVMAREVIAMESARTSAPSLARAWGWRLRAFAMSPDSAEAALRIAVAIVDSTGAKRSVERVDMQLALADIAISEGRIDEASRLADEALIGARVAFGEWSREVSLLKTIAIRSATARNEFDYAAALADTLGEAVSGLHDVNGAVMFALAFAQHEAYLASGHLARAERVDIRAIADVTPMESPMLLVYTLAMAAWTHTLRGDDIAAARELQQAIALSTTREPLHATSPGLRYELAVVFVRLGRIDEARAQVELLPSPLREKARARLRLETTKRR